ncbi:MAG: polysaccharide biosynthesis C-terminal domain-containing protein [Cyclobacteriaceae bacterium]|nr:polysaccharide biosynthesis C-terminal domain-containing protein [Cyclobacteriaceae bacterium]
MTALKRLAGETALYGMGTILPRMLNFLLVPLHTINMFSRAEYGQITKLYAFVAVVNIIYMFGMETAFFRFATKPGADARRVFNLSQTVVIMLSTTLSVIFIFFSDTISMGLNVPAHPEFIIWLALTMWVDAIVAIPFARLRLEKKAMLFASAKIVNVLLLIVLNFYFLKFNYDPSIGIGFVFIANLLANSIFLLFFARTLISWRPAWDKSITQQMLRYAYPVMITGVAGMINEMFSRSMLDWWLPENFYSGITREEAGGIFGACYKFAVFMNLGIQAFRYAAEPFFFSNASDKNSPALFAKVNHYFIVACCMVLVGICLNLGIIKYFTGADFWAGLSIVPILLLAYLFLGIYYNMSVWFKLTDKTYFGTYITLLGVVITVVGNFLLIPVAGFMGSSLAALLCYGSMTVACYLLGQRYYPIPYTIGKDSLYILFTYLVVVAASMITISDTYIGIVINLLLTGVFCGIVFLIERKGISAPAA